MNRRNLTKELYFVTSTVVDWIDVLFAWLVYNRLYYSYVWTIGNTPFYCLSLYLPFTFPLPDVRIGVKGRIFLHSVVFCPYLCTCHSDVNGSDGAKEWLNHTLRWQNGTVVTHSETVVIHSRYTPKLVSTGCSIFAPANHDGKARIRKGEQRKPIYSFN